VFVDADEASSDSSTIGSPTTPVTAPRKDRAWPVPWRPKTLNPSSRSRSPSSARRGRNRRRADADVRDADVGVFKPAV